MMHSLIKHKFYLFFISLVLFISGCSAIDDQPRLAAPSVINEESTVFHLTSENQLGEFTRYIYLPNNQTLENWDTSIELFHDINSQNNSLKQRIALRKKAMNNNPLTTFSEKSNALYASIIYLPNSENNNYQLDVLKGRNVAGCGFVQYQLSTRYPENDVINKRKNKQNKIAFLQQKIIPSILSKLETMTWQWNCK